MPLSDTERQITTAVLRQYLDTHKPTPHKLLVVGFKSPHSLEQLVSKGVLKPIGNGEAYLPRVLAFHYGGDAETLEKAKTAVTTVVYVLRNLFEVDWEKENFTPVEVEQHAQKMFDVPPSADTINLGLFLVSEFANVLSAYGCGVTDLTKLTSLQISQNIVTLKDIAALWDEHVRFYSRYVEEGPPGFRNAFEKEISVEPSSRKVFVVHGHDNAAKEAVARFLEKLGLLAIILHEQANKGATLIEKFEANSDVSFAVVLLTPDDVGGASTDHKTMQPRARQNVVFELGFFVGKLGRERACALYVEGVELPSDFQGVAYVPYDTSDGWRLKLAVELKAAGVEVDLNRVT